MKRAPYIMSVVGLVLLLLAAYSATPPWSGEQPEGSSGTALASSPTTASGTIAIRANVVPAREASLAFGSGGEVTAILIEEGQQVAAGEKLLALDASEEEINLALAQATALKAEADLAAAQAELAAARAAQSAASARVAIAAADAALLAAGPAPGEVAVQQALLAVSLARLEWATSSQALVLEGSSPAAIAAAEADLVAAQTSLLVERIASEHVAQDPDVDPDVRAQAQLRLNAAQAKVTAAQARLDDLRAGNNPAEQQAAAAAVAAADQQRTAGAADLALLQAGAQPEEQAVAAALVEEARRAAEEAAIAVERSEQAVTQAEAARDEAETSSAQAQAAFDRTVIVAPFAGTIATIAVKKGTLVQAGAPVVTLADYSQWFATTLDLTELDVVRVSPGATANVAIDALGGRVVTGRVTHIAATSERLHGNVTYAVTIELQESTLPLRWGMTAIVTILPDEEVQS